MRKITEVYDFNKYVSNKIRLSYEGSVNHFRLIRTVITRDSK